MPVGEVCNREVVVAERDLPVDEAARLMRNQHVGDVIVIDAQGGRARPVGLLTDRDVLVEVVAAGMGADALRVGDIMSDDVATVCETEGVFEAIRYMRDKGVRRMPVVDREGGLVGILTLDDVLALLAEEMVELSRLVSHEQQREVRQRPSL